MKVSENDLLNYYENELSYLRQEGADFAKKFPKIAGRLELGTDESPDPHIERLIESFAFLTARIQKNIDSEFPELSTSLLSNTNPQLLNPIPSMSIAHINVDDTDLPAYPLKLPRHFPMAAYTNMGHRCRFRTCYPIELWPLKIEFAGIGSTGEYPLLQEPQEKPLLHIRIKRTEKVELKSLALQNLRIHINSDRLLLNNLYELLFCNLKEIRLLPDSKSENFSESRPVCLKIHPVGFKSDESALPYPDNVNDAYRLLQEYFTFPEKFMFFDLSGINLKDCTEHFDLLFIFNDYFQRELNVSKDNFLLGCSPIINLFSKLSEPIRTNQYTHEYRINPDSQREHITEIHSIESLSHASTQKDLPEFIEPYFTFKHESMDNTNGVYWHSKRNKTTRPGFTGTDVFLSLVDINFSPTSTKLKTLYAKLLCTNRNLAGSLPQGTWLQSEENYSNLEISIIRKPTQQISAPEGKELWRLVSSLTLNYLSLNSSAESLHALKEILSLYNFENTSGSKQQINGISSMRTRPAVTRLGSENWRGFCRGIEIILEFDLEYFAGNSAFLFASVLNHFFPLYASINSFTQLVAKKKENRGETWKTWPPRSGNRQIL